jgi:hypothetical protein
MVAAYYDLLCSDVELKHVQNLFSTLEAYLDEKERVAEELGR